MDDAAVYTHGHAESVLRSHRTRTVANSAAYLLPHLRPAMTLLDVGSGPGTITADLAELLPDGRVTALEATAEALALTRAEVERRGLTIDYAVGDVQALDLPSDTFDVVHAHQVLQHVADPVAAIAEMVRVCRPGGLVAARDADYGGFLWYPESEGLDHWRSLYEGAVRANGGEPDAGRRLHGWARAAGCTDVTTTASVWCYADPSSRGEWGGMWADRVVDSALATQLVASGAASTEDLQGVAAAWRAWSDHPDGWISILHGEILIRV